MLSVPSGLKIPVCWVHQRKWRSKKPLIMPRLSKGGGSSTAAATIADQKAAKANRYVRLLPKGIAAPIFVISSGKAYHKTYFFSPLKSKYLQKAIANCRASSLYLSILSLYVEDFPLSSITFTKSSLANCIAKLPE